MYRYVELSAEQAEWLQRIHESRTRRAARLDRISIPDTVHDQLVEMGLIRWHERAIEITLDGIRALARHNISRR